MANLVMQADASAGDAWARKNIDLSGGFFGEFIVYVPSSALVGTGSTGAVFYFGDGITVAWTGQQWSWSTYGGGGFSGAVEGDRWYKIQVEYDGVNEVFWTIDGELLFDYEINPSIVTGTGYLKVGSDASEPADLFRFDNVKLGTTLGASNLFSDDFESGTFAAWSSTFGAVSIISDVTGGYVPPPPDDGPPPAYVEPLWRFVVASLDLEIFTFVERLATQRRLTFELNVPAMATGVVPSDNTEVNILAHGTHPFVDEGRRVLLGFRREGGSPPWVIRFAGIIEQLEDSADDNSGPAARTTITAWDPWKYLYARPIVHADGSLPGPAGITFTGLRGNQIATTLLDRTLTYHGEHHIMTGNIHPTPKVGKIVFSQGSSVGEAWTQLCEAGYLDIVLRPVYAPATHPGKLVALNIHEQAGSTRRNAGMAWGAPLRALGAISRLKDGTQRANKYQGYAGQGGPAGVLRTDGTSVAAFGEYWAQEFFPAAAPQVVSALAGERLLVRKSGITTYRARPLSEPAPRPFVDYGLGDCVPIYAGDRLREKLSSLQRVLQIPIEVDDDGTERVTELGFSQDGSSCP